jgi:hypothetical protein
MRKYNAEKWVSCLLHILHEFRTDLWHVRNSAIHGRHSKPQGQTLRHRLLREVHSLYDRDRTCLSLLDKQLFNMPKSYQLKQGNHQLLLWTKRAQMIFDIYEEPIEGLQQIYITDWLNTWSPPLREIIDNTDTIHADGGDSCSDHIRLIHSIKLDALSTDHSSSLDLQSTMDADLISTDSRILDSNSLGTSQVMQKKNLVIGGVFNTTNK